MFSYLGGKKYHSKWISPRIPSNIKTYVEPFGGAMWVYWMSDKVPVEMNIYNDVNRHLTNIFACCATDSERFIGVLEGYEKDIHNETLFEEFKNEIFDIFDEKFDIPNYELAAKYMFCQTQTFAGNTNLTRKVKIYKHPDIVNDKPYVQKFITFTKKLSEEKYLKKFKKLTVENFNFKTLIEKYDAKETFFYIDPPYYNMESYYTADEFGHDDHVELLGMLKRIKGRWALSYYYFDDLERILPRTQYNWHEEKTISMNASNQNVEDTSRIELLIMNYKTGLSFL